MDIDFYNNIEKILTKERLSVYRQIDNATDQITIARYLYNIEVCKSLYPALHIFEICLRNSIDVVLQEFSKREDWYEILYISTEAKFKIDDAKKKIIQRGKSISHDRIIAEMTLGFWTGFITPRYSSQSFQSSIIKKCFKNCSKQSRNVKDLQKILEQIRKLRNRVSHYERIIHWKDLRQQHDKLLEVIKWLNNEAYNLILIIDTFNDTANKGIEPFIEKIQKLRDNT